jgi:nucleoside phosphorylase
MQEKFKDIRVGVIVALAEEYEFFRKYFPSRLVEKFTVGELSIDVLQPDDANQRLGLISVNRMGNVGAAVAATRLLEVFDLDLVVNIGLAGGVDKNRQSLGDIIVANQIRYYETGKLKSDGLHLAPQYLDLNSSFVRALETSDLASWPLGASIEGQPRKVLFGTVASGEKVIAEPSFIKSLLAQDRKIVGIEMEGYGIAAAVHGRKEKFLLIRGLSDFADPKKNDKARLSAMDGAIRFFHQALRRDLLKPSEPSSVVAAPPEGRPKHTLTVSARVIEGGVANTYVQIARTEVISEFHQRKAVVMKMLQKFPTMEDLKTFCTFLNVDFAEMPGQTKENKAAGILDHVVTRFKMSVEDLESLIDA